MKRLMSRAICSILIILFTFFSLEARAETVENVYTEDANNYTFIVKDIKKTEEIVEELKNINNSLDIEFIKEIGIISIKNSELMPSVVQKINSKFINEIEVQGVLPKIKTETSNATNGVNTANILEQYDKFKWHVKDVTNNFLTSGMEQGNKDVKIAVIDSGIDAEHPDLRSLIDSSNSKSYVKDDVSLKDEFGHGTQVAGIIKDIAPNITIEPYKVIGKEDGESYWTIQAIIDATKNHNDIINLSLGTYKVKNKKDEKLIIESYKRAINFSHSYGTLVIASAGNEKNNLDKLKQEEKKLHLPGGLHNLITVSSSMNDDTFAPYSNFGSEIDFTAPAGYFGKSYDQNGTIDVRDMIMTTSPVDKENTYLDKLVGLPRGYTLSFGTSLSAPQVSATAALIISKYERLHGMKPKPQQTYKILKNGAIDIGEKGKDIYFGYGKINAYNSLLLIN